MNKIEAARYLAGVAYATSNDDIEVDDNAEVSAVDEGVWVQAWVFISNGAINDLIGDETNIPPALRK